MRIIKFLIYALLSAGCASCGTSATSDSSSEAVSHDTVADTSIISAYAENGDLIKSVYDKFVFAIDTESEEINHPEKYFTAHALKKLQDAYDFDCDDGPCYAFYALRTEANDSKPGTDEASVIYTITSVGDGWYIVSYSDMGWPGQTRIRAENGKIDDYERL